jgi:hypothetical protein
LARTRVNPNAPYEPKPTGASDPIGRLRLRDRRDDVPLFLAGAIELLDQLVGDVVDGEESGRQLTDELRLLAVVDARAAALSRAGAVDLFSDTSIERVEKDDAEGVGVEDLLHLGEDFFELARLELGGGRHQGASFYTESA